jgi:hypothetical protein
MVKAKSIFAGIIQVLPMLSRGLKQVVGAKNISLNKLARAINRTIYVRFGCEMHNGVWLMSLEQIT